MNDLNTLHLYEVTLDDDTVIAVLYTYPHLNVVMTWTQSIQFGNPGPEYYWRPSDTDETNLLLSSMVGALIEELEANARRDRR